MRALTLAAVLLSSVAAHAERLFPPVKINQTGVACRQLSSIQYRDSLVRDQRDEQLSRLNLVYGTSGECWPVQQGKYMFYEGYDAKGGGAYICLRPRAGADCLWINRQAVGDIPELFPGHKVTQGNQGVPCAAWDAVVKKSEATDKAIMKEWSANQPSGDGNPVTEIAQGMVTGMLGMVTGGPDSHKARSLNLCQMYLSSAQEQARRLTAFTACPQLASPEKRASEANAYRTNIAEINRSCLGRPD